MRFKPHPHAPQHRSLHRAEQRKKVQEGVHNMQNPFTDCLSLEIPTLLTQSLTP